MSASSSDPLELTHLHGFIGFSSANKCLLKVAQYAAQMENYAKAIEVYEEVISQPRHRLIVVGASSVADCIVYMSDLQLLFIYK